MTDNPKILTILGSTGSIGVQTLEVIDSIQDHFEINYLTTNSRIDILTNQIEKYHPKGVVIGDEKLYLNFKRESNFIGKILYGEEGLCEAASDSINDLTVSALVGFSGVIPTLSAIKAGINIALANKETLVSAGSIIIDEARKYNVQIFAIDSEHSAVLQCIVGENKDEIEKIILTASGGPFLNTPIEDFKNITVNQALAHPNWSMGNKITIDSATMINKGFEIIEAFWLFDIELSKIEVVIHPQSIIHSMVQFVDGSIKAQMGLPDMRVPISYALTYPMRMKNNFKRLDFNKFNSLTFSKPDLNRFPCLRLAYDSLNSFGNSTAVLNAANEIAVNGFLKNQIPFNAISVLVETTLMNINHIDNPTIDDIVNTNLDSRNFTTKLLHNN